MLGTPALVATKSRELIALFGDTRRFILEAGCAIPATAPEAREGAWGLRIARWHVRVAPVSQVGLSSPVGL